MENIARETEAIENIPVNGEREANADAHEVTYRNSLFARNGLGITNRATLLVKITQFQIKKR